MNINLLLFFFSSFYFSCGVEPVGSKAPALTGILKGGWMRQNSASHIVLTCPAQGYPVPAFR